jgi:Flp pilus assembly pilin Flp
MNSLILRAHCWFKSHLTPARFDDRGALSTEAALITALLALGGVGVVGVIVAAATGWANSIPGP